MKWILYDFKSAKESWFEEAESAYLKKINHFINFEIQHLKTNKSDRDQAEIKIKFEENILLQKIMKDDFVILFDEKGQSLNSIHFSSSILKANESGKRRGVLLIGGAYGVSEAIRKKATLTLCLSSFVMNHLVAEVVVLEQFYRAQTILNRIPYHNA